MTQKVAETAGKEYGMYIKTMENRKVLVKRLEQLTRTKAVYTRMPECAFVVGDFKVERYGTLVIGEDAEVIETLLSEGMIKEYAPEPAPEPEREPEPSKVEVSFPMEGHTARSLRNLAAMLYSRGRLISKSTGGEFSCSADQMEKLKEADTVPAFLEAVREDFKGIAFEGDALTFTGFPETRSASRIRTYTQLASMMNALAIHQGACWRGRWRGATSGTSSGYGFCILAWRENPTRKRGASCWLPFPGTSHSGRLRMRRSSVRD